MEILVNFVFGILAIAQLTAGDYGERIKNATVIWGGNLQMEESRFYPQTELPVTFQAPFINARDYWNDPARRTGFDYNPYFLKPITDGINSFYDIMHTFFGEDPPRPFRPEDPPQRPFRPEDPPFRPPLRQEPFRPFHPPKPLRATIQKLEPSRGHFPVPYPQFVKILNEVLAENPKPEPVLEKPNYVYEYVIPTTYKPQNRFKIRKTTPFPVSIQDQLPPVKDGENTKIPYVTEQTTKSEEDKTTTTEEHHTEITTQKEPDVTATTPIRPETKIVFPSVTESVPPQLDVVIDVRNAQLGVKPPVFTTESSTLDVEVTTNGETGLTTPIEEIITPRMSTTDSPLLDTMEQVKSNRFQTPFPKSLQLTTESADYVTDLTVQGLTDHAAYTNVPLQTRNLSSVIGHLIKEINATAPPFQHPLSLDEKILKDTNWDGFQVPETTSLPPETTQPTQDQTTEATQPDTTEPMPYTTEPFEDHSETTEPRRRPGTTLEPSLDTTEPRRRPGTTLEPSLDTIEPRRRPGTTVEPSPDTTEPTQGLSETTPLSETLKQEERTEPTQTITTEQLRTSEQPIEQETFVVETRMSKSVSRGYKRARRIGEEITEPTRRKYKRRRIQNFTPRSQDSERKTRPRSNRIDVTTEKKPAISEEELKKRRNLYLRRNPSQFRRSGVKEE